MRSLWILGVLGAGLAHAASPVQVEFGQITEFSDFGQSVLERERNEKELRAHLEGLAARLPAGQTLSVRIKDVNLAGEMEWMRRRAEHLRVLRDVSAPAIELSFVLSAGSQVLKQEDMRLRDLAYLQLSLPAALRDGPLRYEKRMLDRWFEETILGKPAR